VQGQAALDSRLAERAVVVVMEEQAGSGIAGHIDIWPAIIVQIRCYGGQAVAVGGLGNPRALAHVDERAVAVVVIEAAPVGRQSAWTAIHWDAFEVADFFLLGRHGPEIEAHVMRNKKIQVTVAIVVDEGAAAAEAGPLLPQPGPFGDVRKGAIAIVAVEDVVPPTSDEQILEAVIVVVANRNAVSPARVRQARPFSHVCESAIAIVPV